MAKFSKKRLDLAMACEHDKALSPFTLTIKHVRCLEKTGKRFLFTYQVNGTIYYDSAEVVSTVMGVRCKPAYFLLPEIVKQRLFDKVYTRWYFEDADYIYPVQSCKIPTLMDAFIWVEGGDRRRGSHVVVDPEETMFLRKKPLVRVRRSNVTWDDVSSKPQIVKSTVRRRVVDADVLEPA